MKLAVKDIKHVLTTDIDVSQQFDVAELDKLVRLCSFAARDAMSMSPADGFSAPEWTHLPIMFENLVHSHESIRTLLLGERNASAVDALVIARVQLETLYTLCFLLEDHLHVQLFLKNAWKKKYVRFLLHREELISLQRFEDYYNRQALVHLNSLQGLSFVTYDERKTIEEEELGPQANGGHSPTRIKQFPTPMKVIERIRNDNQREMLKRLYPEYQFLCSFAHGDFEASFFRAVSDPRSAAQRVLRAAKIEDFYQREVLEAPLIYSALSVVQAATEIAAIYPTNVELRAKVTNAWTRFLEWTLSAAPIYEIRAKTILGVI